jgi:TolA-binding protein/Flp pilus assembly protein TadD
VIQSPIKRRWRKVLFTVFVGVSALITVNTHGLATARAADDELTLDDEPAPKETKASKSAPKAEKKSEKNAETSADLKGEELRLDDEEVDDSVLTATLNNIDQRIAITRKEISRIRDATYLPDLYFSLAELDVQKARFLVQIKIAQNPGKKIEDLDFVKEKKPKQEAIEIYQKIYTFFPKYDKRDKALFLRGIEHRDLGQFEEMLRAFNLLSNDFPSSPHFNEANIILGDYLLDVKKDYDLAIVTFQKVAARPLSPFTPLAEYRLGKAYVGKLDYLSAMYAFERAIEKGGQIDLSGLPAVYRKADVRREAVSALVIPYAEVYAAPDDKMVKPDSIKNHIEPYIYFQKKSPDHLTYRRVLGQLGRRLIVKEKWREAADAFYHVLVLSTDFDPRFDALQRINESRKRKAAKVDLLGVVRETGITADLLQAAQAQPIIFTEGVASNVERLVKNKAKPTPASKVLTELAFLELLMRDWATQLHSEAVASGSPAIYQQAAEAYDLYLGHFPVSPKFLDMRLNRAESLYKADQWVKAGVEYERLSRLAQMNKRSSEFKESAVESYTKALGILDKLTAIDKIRARKGLRTVGADWIKENPSRRGASSASFNIANSWYEERNLKKAIESFKSYIHAYPKDEKVRDAIFLIINSYSQLDDYKGLEKAGDQMIKTVGLSADDQKTIRDAVTRARSKDLQAAAGDFGTKEYAENLLSVASKYKGSALGVQALYEAFQSLKSKKDPELFEVGEAMLDQHADSDYAKEITSSMATLALNAASFDRAARYLARFADKYPKENESLDFRKTSATLYERQGDFKKARVQYQKLGDKAALARMDFALSDWPALANSSLESGSPDASYWHAIAIWRQKKYSEAIPLLKALADDTKISPDHSGHAKFLLAQLSLDRLSAIKMKSAEDQAALVSKVQAFQALSADLQSVIKSNSGHWPIAALYVLGQAHYDLGHFIADSPLPTGLSDADKTAYMAELDKQASSYLAEANKVFAQCIEAAQANDIFTHYVDGCRGKGKVVIHEEDDLARPTSNISDIEPNKAKPIRKELFSKAQDPDLLFQLADVYLLADQPQTASGIYSRILELQADNPRATASKGVAALYLRENDLAYDYFKAALDANDKEPIALWNLAGLYKHFNFQAKADKMAARAKAVARPKLLHTWAKDI